MTPTSPTPEPAAAPALLTGRTVVVTGASDGIGAAAVPLLQGLGAEVVIVGRSPSKTAAVAAATGAESFVADFADLSQVVALAEGLKGRRIDVLANNAGFAAAKRVVTVDGHEATFQVNHLAPFLLTRLLEPELVESRATVIQTSSAGNLAGHVRIRDLDLAHRYTSFGAYATSKLENVLFTRELQQRWGSRGVTAASFHPGVIASSFGQRSSLPVRLFYGSFGRVLSTSGTGADTLVWLSSSEPGVDWTPGGHYANRRRAPVSPTARNPRLAERLWEESERMVGPFLP